MINKKFGFILAAGILSLAACGEETQPTVNDDTEVEVEEQENVSEEETSTEAGEEESATEEETSTEAEEEESVTEEETSAEAEEEEESATDEEDSTEAGEEEAEEESLEEDSAEAMSGAASPLLSEGETTSFVFNEAGEFAIFCEPHPVMKMNVVVEEGAEQVDEVAIDIADYEFGEETITVAPGTTIVWTNQDLAQHNVAIR